MSDCDADGVVEGLAVGVAELAVGLGPEVVGLAEVSDGVGVAAAVTVAVAVAAAVAVVVVVAVTTGVGVTEAVSAGAAGVEAPEVGVAGGVVVGAGVGAADRDGRLVPLAVGRLTAGPVAVSLGDADVEDGRGSPLALRLGDAVGRVTEPPDAIGGLTDCPQPVRRSPAAVRSTAARTPTIVCSSCRCEPLSPAPCTLVPWPVRVVTRLE